MLDLLISIARTILYCYLAGVAIFVIMAEIGYYLIWAEADKDEKCLNDVLIFFIILVSGLFWPILFFAKPSQNLRTRKRRRDDDHD